MNSKPLFLSAHGQRITLNALPQEDRFAGTIQIDDLSESQRQLFTEFEEIVEGQMFSLLDEVEDRIRACGFEAVWEDGSRTSTTELQVFPSTGAISFRTAHASRVSLNGSNTGKIAIDNPESAPRL